MWAKGTGWLQVQLHNAIYRAGPVLATLKVLYTTPAYRRARAEYARRADAVGPQVAVVALGKTGSTTLHHTLQVAFPDHLVHQVHRLSPSTARSFERRHRRRQPGSFKRIVLGAWYLSRHRPTSGAPWLVVTPVREPVARVVSLPFEGAHVTGLEIADIDAVTKAVLGHPSARLTETWFETELEGHLGVDVYAGPFPHDVGWKVYEGPNVRVLVIRAEDMAKAPEALTDFIGREVPQLVSANVGAEKAYATGYRKFLDEVRLPEAFVDRLLDGRYARHFYTDTERDLFRRRWVEGRGTW